MWDQAIGTRIPSAYSRIWQHRLSHVVRRFGQGPFLGETRILFFKKKKQKKILKTFSSQALLSQQQQRFSIFFLSFCTGKIPSPSSKKENDCFSKKKSLHLWPRSPTTHTTRTQHTHTTYTRNKWNNLNALFTEILLWFNSLPFPSLPFPSLPFPAFCLRQMQIINKRRARLVLVLVR